jgi:hypothetical protein
MKKPSVTELLDLLNKPALLSWANKIGLQGISLDSHRRKARKAGTSLHKQIERYVADKTPFDDLDFQARFVEFFEGKEIIQSEGVFECDEYQGRFDIKYRHNGLVYIADFKTDKQTVYLEDRLQLAAYRKATGSDAVCIISIPTMKELNAGIIIYEPYYETLTLLSKLYALKFEL